MEREQTVGIGATPVELQMTSADLVATGGRARCGKEFARCQRVVLPYGEDLLAVLEFGCCECGEHASVRVTGIVRVCRVVPAAEPEGRIE
jgi:hypothetical protein